jgi:hypothetical protein
MGWPTEEAEGVFKIAAFDQLTDFFRGDDFSFESEFRKIVGLEVESLGEQANVLLMTFSFSSESGAFA